MYRVYHIRQTPVPNNIVTTTTRIIMIMGCMDEHLAAHLAPLHPQVLDAAMKRYPTTLQEDLALIHSLPASQAEPLVKEAPKASAPKAEPLVAHAPDASAQAKQAQRKRLAAMVRIHFFILGMHCSCSCCHFSHDMHCLCMVTALESAMARLSCSCFAPCMCMPGQASLLNKYH